MYAKSAMALLLCFGLFDGEADDKAKLQGKWKVVSTYTGNPETDKRFLGTVIQFDGDTIHSLKDGKREGSSAFKLDSSKKPKEIDLFGKDPVPQNPEIPLLGIYAIEGDRLKLSWSKIDGKFRPQSFELPEGKNKTRQVSFVLERVKK